MVGLVPESGRRGFIKGVMGAVGSLIALGYAFVAERFMLPPPAAAATLQKAGKSADFPTNTAKLVVYTGDGGFPDGVYIVRLAKGLAAYDEHCAHLQCPVQWSQPTLTFNCPCHGSVYNVYGKNVGGPAPHPLNYHRIVEHSGEVYVGGIVPWGTPEWTKMAQAMGAVGKFVPGKTPGTIRWSTKV